jgi:pyrroloquinoline quinone (PQQ) biosynthesis protein C
LEATDVSRVSIEEMIMTSDFQRTGDLMDLRSYPAWIQRVVAACEVSKQRVARHEVYRMMKDNEVPNTVARSFLIGVWPVIWQFPQYMAMSLQNVAMGVRGHDLARTYLIRNIRVESKHAELWVNWAQAHGVSHEELVHGERPAAAEALSHWCWHTCERMSLPIAIAATNYAIEGVTGEWSSFICSSSAYEEGFAPEVRRGAMKWLRVHAEYDDTHPWEALEIVATVLGHCPSEADIHAVQSSIRKSYDYMRLTLDDCLATWDMAAPVNQAA